MRQLFVLSVLLTGCICLAACAQEKTQEKKGKTAPPKNKVAFLSGEAAGKDFEIQGEYSGPIHDGQNKLGLQVVALGDGQFEGFAYLGGLPGDGWDGETRLKVAGKTEGEVTRLVTDMGSAEIKDGVASCYDTEGNRVGELAKVWRKSPTMGKKAPVGAVVLFDGTSADHWVNGRVENKLLCEGTRSKAAFDSCTLHLEFMLSFMPYARGQARSNSGCYVQSRYETQILDSFGLTGEHNECGGIYEIAKPKVNMCLPPLSWQTYDIDFTAAKFDQGGMKVSNARMTVRHNGVLIHDNVEVPRATRAAPMKEGPEPGPIYLQNHGNPLRFRNIWVVPASAAVSD